MKKRSGSPARRIAPGNYRFRVVDRKLTMPDGLELGTTIYMPYRKKPGERFPVLLEILPYRKDDTFFVADYPSYSYFAKHGYIVAKVDIRGTGASPGPYPDREYSDIELADAEEIIAQLAAMPVSNGKVAMWGVSWSGFNSIQVAMRRPEALKTILIMHASDDLFHDDIHYIDGVLHLDPYHLFINHETGLPRTPLYRLDRDYFENRFAKKPWLFEYLGHPQDGSFWRVKSLRQDYGAIDIPVYIVGGLNDGYRDTVIRILENLDAPVRAEMGPWDHSCPDNGGPGPNYEWHDEAIAWFDHWLKGRENGIGEESRGPRRLTVFVREGDRPDPGLETATGHWRHERWPIERTRWTSFYPSSGKRLLKGPGKPARDHLVYAADSGTAAGHWWGDTTGDMREDDKTCLIYDTEPLSKKAELIGRARVNLRFIAPTRRLNFSVRLEDVAPDGSVAMVTGALINSRHIDNRLEPSDLVPGKIYDLTMELHFSTWTFKKGHRIRMAVSNAQFPMAWPSPEPMTTSLIVGEKGTRLILPVVPGRASSRPDWIKVKDKLEHPRGANLSPPDGRPELARYVRKNKKTGTTSYIHETNSAYRVKKRRFDISGKSVWTTLPEDPARSSYTGTMSTRISGRTGSITLKTRINVMSDRHSFVLRVTRAIYRNNKRIRQKTWRQVYPRTDH